MLQPTLPDYELLGAFGTELLGWNSYFDEFMSRQYATDVTKQGRLVLGTISTGEYTATIPPFIVKLNYTTIIALGRIASHNIFNYWRKTRHVRGTEKLQIVSTYGDWLLTYLC